MKPFYAAKRRQAEEIDYYSWMMGQYVASAISLLGKGGKYPDKPFSQKEKLQSEIYDDETVSEKEKEERQRKSLELLFAQLDVMGRNANIEKERKKREEEMERAKAELKSEG